MIICDICKKQTRRIETIVLHTKAIDVCINCRTEVKEILKQDEEIFDKEYKNFRQRIKQKEENLINYFSSK